MAGANSELAGLPAQFGEAVASIKERLPPELRVPTWGIICGSGLSGLVDHIEDKVLLDYTSIPVRGEGNTSRGWGAGEAKGAVCTGVGTSSNFPLTALPSSANRALRRLPSRDTSRRLRLATLAQVVPHASPLWRHWVASICTRVTIRPHVSFRSV